MEFATRPQFDSTDRRDIFEYVERHGATSRAKLKRVLDMDRHPRAFGHHVAILKRDDVLEEVDGKLRLAFETGDEEEVEIDGQSVTIRQARQEDLTGLLGAIREAIGGGQYVRAETVADVVDNEGVLLRHNDIESRIFFVATVDGEVVGWAHLNHLELEKLRHTAEFTLGVLEEYRGMGIGSHLLKKCLDWASSQQLEKLYNSLPASNEGAIDFLKAHGFVIEATREDHYKFEDEYVDEVMLALELS